MSGEIAKLNVIAMWLTQKKYRGDILRMTNAEVHIDKERNQELVLLWQAGRLSNYKLSMTKWPTSCVKSF